MNIPIEYRKGIEYNDVLPKLDLTALEWSVSRQTAGTAGTYLKSTQIIDNKKLYYKASSLDLRTGIAGHEAVTEVLVCRLANLFRMDCLQYGISIADIMVAGDVYKNVPVTLSEDFKKGKQGTPFEQTFSRKDSVDDMIRYISEKNGQKYIDDMFVLDYLIYNRDRHGANIEVIGADKNKKLAPMFDHGCSLAFTVLKEEDAARFDILKDNPVNNYIGSPSVRKNLQYVSKDYQLPVITKPMFEALSYGLENCDEKWYLDLCIKMMEGRYAVLKNLFR